MFTIDFTKPWLYKDIIYFNQGNLSTNNTLRCKLVTGGSDDFTGGSIACTFTTKDSVEISGFGKLVDAKNGIIDIVFPSNALVVGTNKLEVLVNRADGGVAQSPPVMYDIWKGLTTGNGIEAETNYPILIQLINSVNEASNQANATIDRVNSMQTDVTDAIDNAYRSANDADIATSKAYSKIEEVETAKTEMIKKVDTSIVTMKSEVEVAKNEMASKSDEKIADVDRALAAGTKDLEVKEARRDMDGVEHATLKVRLESDLKKGKVIEETKQGEYISFNETVKAPISLELHGNTVQDLLNLVDIESSGIDNGDGTFTYTIVACGENLNAFTELGNIGANGSEFIDSNSIRSAYIKVYKGMSIGCMFENNDGSISNQQLWINRYDNNKKFIDKELTSSKLFTVTHDGFIRIQRTISDIKNILVKADGIPLKFIPYEETRCDIKLPCQLEKWDRLYFDKEENAWCVDKVMQKTPFKVSNFEKIYGNATARMTPPTDAENGKGKMFIEGFSELNNVADWQLPQSINKFSNKAISPSWIDLILDKTVYDTIDKAKAFEGKMVYYKLTTPKKIVLPQSEQIKLNSFANKTHICTISGEVDATVKATVSKSLASTVQANTEEINLINNKIADIEGLKETQDFSYETDKGYLVCKDTQNGVVKDLKLYGKSLVSKFSKKHTETNITVLYSGILSTTGFKVEIGKTYTILGSVKSPTKNMCDIYYQESNVNIGNFKGVPFVFTANKNETLRFVSLETGLYVLDDIMVLEGDYSQNPPQYFEGIASVGNGNGIEVSSVNENLFDGKLELGAINWSNGENYDLSKDRYRSVNYIQVPSNTLISSNIKGQFFGIVEYDYNKKFIKSYSNIATITTSSNSKFIRIVNTLDEDINVSIGTLKPYTPRKQDKKTTLFKDVDNTWKPITNLRGINENNCDIVDSINSVYSVKVKEITNLKDLRWTKEGNFENKDTYFYKLEDGLKITNITEYDIDCVCDKLKSVSVNYITGAMHSIVDCVAYDVRYQVVRISVPKDTNLVEYLTNLNSRFIYPLNEVEEYETNPIYPESYDNETMILIDGGVISPHASWKITSSLPNFVKELSNQIKQLQDQAYKNNVANFAVALNTLDTKLRLDRLEAPQM